MDEHLSPGRQANRVANGVAYWSAARWRVPAPGGGDRVAAMVALIQTLADVGARAERRPIRPVPRLSYDTALPDQLRVVAADLNRSTLDEEQTAIAEKAIARARSVLF